MVVSIWHCESGSFALQNIRFYRAKPTLLERQTIGFTVRSLQHRATLSSAVRPQTAYHDTDKCKPKYLPPVWP